MSCELCSHTKSSCCSANSSISGPNKSRLCTAKYNIGSLPGIQGINQSYQQHHGDGTFNHIIGGPSARYWARQWHNDFYEQYRGSDHDQLCRIRDYQHFKPRHDEDFGCRDDIQHDAQRSEHNEQ
ncbi:hypothetical protein G7054_g47 [Neopestalotiopsis clavispora]|nr:hypothetical protein G7054_g47 [Neopestalotiopsis clavispora]